MTEAWHVTCERDEQSRNPDRRTPLSILREDYPGDDLEGYEERCGGCGTPGVLHSNGCPPDPWHPDARWCEFCLGPLRPDEPAEKPCDRCVAEKHDERDKDYRS